MFEPAEHHGHGGDGLVAAGDGHDAVEHVAARHELDRVGDDLAADERALHALGAHRDAVGDRDRVDLDRACRPPPARPASPSRRASGGSSCRASSRSSSGRRRSAAASGPRRRSRPPSSWRGPAERSVPSRRTRLLRAGIDGHRGLLCRGRLSAGNSTAGRGAGPARSPAARSPVDERGQRLDETRARARHAVGVVQVDDGARPRRARSRASDLAPAGRRGDGPPAARSRTRTACRGAAARRTAARLVMPHGGRKKRGGAPGRVRRWRRARAPICRASRAGPQSQRLAVAPACGCRGHAPRRRCAARRSARACRPLPDQEEGRPHALARQDVEHARRVRPGPGRRRR